MEKRKDRVEEYVRRVVTPIFDQALRETPSNPVSVRGGVGRVPSIVYYQPHNLRLYFDFSRVGFRPERLYKTDPETSVRAINRGGSDTEVSGFMGCRVVVRRRTVEVCNMIERGRWFPIDLEPFHRVGELLAGVVGRKVDEARSVVRELVSRCGGRSGLVLVREPVGEHKVMGDAGVRGVPDEWTFRTGSGIKKVYHEPNVEFPSVASVVRYLENRSVESVAPRLSAALVDVAKIANPLGFVKSRVRVLEDLFGDEVVGMVRVLCVRDRREFQRWLFERFGGV